MSHFLDAEASEDGADEKPCFIHGIAYAQGMKYRVTDTLDPKITDPQNDPAYLWDPAVRLTHKQMGQDMTGLPMLFEHDHRHRVGTILHNFLDKENHLNIIAEVDQKSNLGKWVARNVRAGLLQDLSIGYPTGVQAGTRKVQHKDKVDEVSFVIGGFFPGCEVKVRASKNQGYKNPRQQQESSKQIRIVRVMATAGEVQTQQPPAAALAPTEPERPKTSDSQDLIDIAMMKKMMMQLQAENERLQAKDQINEESEKKRREEYAISNQPKYEEAMAIVEELAKEDGEPVTDQYKQELKYSALNPEGKHMFQNTVRVTASVRKLKAEKAVLAKQVEDMLKENALRKDMLSDVALLATNPAREQKRADKVAQRSAEQPLDAIMTPDHEAPHTKPPAWLMGLTGRQMGQSDDVWRTHGIDSNPNPLIQEPVAQPPAVAAPAVPQTLAAEQTQQSTPVPVNASLQTQRRAAPTSFRSSYKGSQIQYPRMQGMAASNKHDNVWSFLKSIDDSQGFMSGGHLAGKDFGTGH